MRCQSWGNFLGPVLMALLLTAPDVRANPGDVDNAQDYPAFPRQAGFIISDYDEDNPAAADFPVVHALPLDSDHVDLVRARGHRFLIRYELSSGSAPSVYQTQRYYEKLAADAGFDVVKNGAVGDVSETFCHSATTHDIWVHVVPSNGATYVSIVEAPSGSTPITTAPPRLTVSPAAAAIVTPPTTPPPPVSQEPRAKPLPPAPPPKITPVPTTTSPASAISSTVVPPAPVTDPDGEAIYAALSQQGRSVLPFVFQPGKDDLDATSQPLVDRVVAMMEKHSELFLRIEGHTDNSGDPELNLRLSAQRALAVQARLLGAGVDRKRLDAVGVGGLQPRADNSTAEGREKNRRIELVLWKKYSHRPTAGGA